MVSKVHCKKVEMSNCKRLCLDFLKVILRVLTTESDAGSHKVSQVGCPCPHIRAEVYSNDQTIIDRVES
jgi:hypothetical protein